MAFVAVLEERKQDANAQIKPVEQHIGQHGKGDQAGPDQGEVRFHGLAHRRDVRCSRVGGNGRDACRACRPNLINIDAIFRSFAHQAHHVKSA